MSSKHPEAGEIRDREGVRRSLDGLTERDGPGDHGPPDRGPQRDELPFRALLFQGVDLAGIEADGAQVGQRRPHLRALRDRLRRGHFPFAVRRDLLLGELLLSHRVRVRRGERRLGGDVFAARLARLHALDLREDLSLLHRITDADVEAHDPPRHRRAHDGEVILRRRDRAHDLDVPGERGPFDLHRLERGVGGAALG